MPSQIAPLQGFGDSIASPTGMTSNVYFSVIRARGTDIPLWDFDAIIRSFPIPGSFPPRIVRQLVGYTPATVTWRLQLDSIADLQRLTTMITSEATLTIVAGIQNLPATHHDIDGVAYEELPQTTLLDLANPLIEVSGGVEVDATFQRTVDPATLAVTP